MFRHGELTIDPGAFAARFRGRLVPLRPNEFRLLLHFVTHPDQVFSRASIIEHLGKAGRYGSVGQFGWGFDFKPQFFAANGYVVIEPNPRGSTGRGQDFVRAIYQTWGITDYDDLIAAGSMVEAKRHGHVRSEGKTYAVKDGDVINVLFTQTKAEKPV